MLRFTPIANAAHAESYYARTDGGYYLGSHQLGCEWLGKGAGLLGLAGRPDYEAFKRLIHGLDPHSGEQLTPKLNAERTPRLLEWPDHGGRGPNDCRRHRAGAAGEEP